MPNQSSGSSDANPLVRFYNDPGPWTSQRIEPPAPAPMGSHNSSWDEHLSQPNGALHQYREPARSEVESSVTGRQPSDSGYGRSYATMSVLSADQGDQNQDCRSVTSQIGIMQMYPEHTPREYMAGESQTSQTPAFGTQDDVPESQSSAHQPLRCAWEGCHTISKNQSEYRKHSLRHEKPYRCEVPDCTRMEGFSTKNDLERHRKSKHKLVPTTGTDRSFRCAAPSCPKKEKIWPRLDNFRQHCKRMHTEEDVEVLVAQSELEPGCPSGSNAGETDDVGRESRPPDEDSNRTEPESMCYTNLQALQKLPGLPSQQDGTFSEPPAIESANIRASNDPMGAGVRIKCSISAAHCGPEIRNSPSSWPTNKAPGSGLTSFPGCSSGLESSLQVSLPPSLGHDEGAMPSTSNSTWQSQPTHNTQGNAAPKSGGAAFATKADQLSIAIGSGVEPYVNRASQEDVQKVINDTVRSFLESARKSSAADTVSPTTCGPKAKLVSCDECSKTVHRHCDLRKHKKRHSRPYGCTYTTCTKAFGSKNDWKRHENSQHYQLEAWRCHEHDSSSLIKQCAKIFYRREPFQNHLKERHGIKDEDVIKAQSKRGRIGKNCQSGFWCGFCKSIVALKTKGLDAWDERFNHIDDLHFKKGERIGQWYPLDKDIPKSLLRSENVLDSGTRALLSPDEDEGSSDEDNERDPANDRDDNSTPATSLSSPPLRQAGRGKHAVDNEAAANDGRCLKRQRQSRVIFCCQCNAGPYNKDTHPSCTLGCQHQLCTDCPVE
ncbi:Zinc finger, C2H2-like [Lasallia pustulata]|uniref:Zinc finger, C2H2-like n=1 Tax=Lasallia pustulata TaxID=136370 RepID=A0A1W5DCC7_9LECA|nr:Zinc finger, C2H2-like [Lasallia pustulata]